MFPPDARAPVETKILALTDAAVTPPSAEGPGSFSGYASRWDTKDLVGDIVTKGAFSKTLPDFRARGFIAWGHDWDNPVATIREAREDERGLYLEADFHSDPQSQIARTRAAERLARGKFMGLSIGFRTLDAEDTPKGRLLKEIELFETSLVTVPALPSAGVLAAKAAERAAAGAAAADVETKVGRRISAANLARIRAAVDALSQLLADAEPAPDAEDDAAAAPADAGAESGVTHEAPAAEIAAAPTAATEAKDAPPVPLADAATTLLADLDAFVSRVARADAADLAESAAWAHGALRRLSAARAEVDALTKRAAATDAISPRDLARQFAALDARLGFRLPAAPATPPPDPIRTPAATAA